MGLLLMPSIGDSGVCAPGGSLSGDAAFKFLSPHDLVLGGWEVATVAFVRCSSGLFRLCKAVV